MVTLANVRDFLKSFKLFEGYYIGKIDASKNNVLGVYSLENNLRHKCIGNAEKYEIKAVSLLIHGDNNKDRTEQLANKLYKALSEALSEARNCTIGKKKVYIIQLQQDAPIDVDTDGSIYEYVIEVLFYVEK